MVVIARLFAMTKLGEQMVAIQILEQPRCILVAGQRNRLLRRDRRRDCRQHERAPILGARVIQYLAGEVPEDRFLSLADRLVGYRTLAAVVLAQQHQRSGPAVALLENPPKVVGVEAGRSQYRPRFLGCATELRGVDIRDATTGKQTRELG